MYYFKGISRQSLDNRMQEYKAENEMLASSLEQAKGSFQKNLEEIIVFIRYVRQHSILFNNRLPC